MNSKIKVLSILDEEYPQSLREISNPPEKLYTLGDVSILNKKSISIVGTRKATKIGLEIAEKFAEAFSRNDFCIVSGLALGIDSAAHIGAIRKSKTIAVVARGLDKIYPDKNASLAQKIIETGGVIISEYPPGTSAMKHFFLQRNRITSGISIASIIIEAPYKSGAINTAGWAAEQGKFVFVVPGPINHQNYKGSHKLIRDGAILVSSPEEVLSDLGIENKNIETEKINLSETEKMIFNIINQNAPITADEIITKSNLETHIATISIVSLLTKNLILESQWGYAVAMTY